MIAIDGSAILAIMLRDPHWEDCVIAVQADSEPVISAATLAELRIVALCREMAEYLDQVVDMIQPEIVSVSEATAQRVALAYARWGRGFHPAALNFGDCFSYVLAKDLDCPLLFVGDEFSKTDGKNARLAKRKTR